MKSGTGLRRWGHRRYKTSGGFGDGEAPAPAHYNGANSSLSYQLSTINCSAVIACA